MTAPTRPDVRIGHDCYRTARVDGLIPALDLLTGALLPDMVPFGPAGHAVAAATVAGSASQVWLDGIQLDREPARERTLTTAGVPDGLVVILRTAVPAEAGRRCAVQHDAWLSGLAWLRLGLSEALRETCSSYLGGRRTGVNSTLLQQQMVKGSIAEAVSCHLEAHAVLRSGDAVTTGMAERLHGMLTAADRELVRLLGASGYVTGGHGQVANLGELLADAYRRGEPRW